MLLGKFLLYSNPLGKNLPVLIIDNNKEDAEIVDNVVKKLGKTSVKVNSAEVAREFLRREAFSAVLLNFSSSNRSQDEDKECLKLCEEFSDTTYICIVADYIQDLSLKAGILYTILGRGLEIPSLEKAISQALEQAAYRPGSREKDAATFVILFAIAILIGYLAGNGQLSHLLTKLTTS